MNTEQFWSEPKPIGWVETYEQSYDRDDRKQLIDVLKNLHWNSILEVGCNCAPILSALKNSFTEFIYDGLDINGVALAKAKRNHPASHFYFGNAEIELPKFADDSYDLILSSSFLSALNKEDAEFVLNEMIRISSKYIVIQEPHFEKHEGNFHWWNHDYSLMNLIKSNKQIIILD